MRAWTRRLTFVILVAALQGATPGKLASAELASEGMDPLLGITCAVANFLCWLGDKEMCSYYNKYCTGNFP